MSEKSNQNHEQVARDAIDAQLRDAGWFVQNKNAIDFNKGVGQAVREYTTDCGPRKHTLLIMEQEGFPQVQEIGMKEIIQDLEIACKLDPMWKKPSEELEKIRNRR